MPEPGPHNLITDVPGVTVGNATDDKVKTGVTVLRCAASAVAAVDIRGGAPGTRETDVLAPENLVGRADAFVLTGGSVFGLGAADAVAAALSAADVGLKLGDGGPPIPIVSAAVLHDLGNNGDKGWGDDPPYRHLGAEALGRTAVSFDLGAVGAGRGAMAGAVKGGLGSASAMLDSGVVVGALVAVNSVGSVLMPDGETFYAWPWETGHEFGGRPPPAGRDEAGPFPSHSRFGKHAKPGTNTVIAVVATSADLTRVEAKRLAIMAHDGIARAVRPAHTPFDGDVVFAAATGTHSMPDPSHIARAAIMAEIGAVASDCLARAIARGVYEARRNN